MSLSSVLQTGLTGLANAEQMVNRASNNLANLLTPGYKGTPPVFTQGQIALGASPSSLALQGDGLFILEGPQGERSYTRDGRFQLNANQELVTSDGYRVLGYTVSDNLELDTTHLAPLSIPLGKQVAGNDGSVASLLRYGVGKDGRISGSFSDGTTRDLGQLRLARFTNPDGLEQRGDNRYAESPNSGRPMETAPGQGAAASVIDGAVELSSVDIGESLVDLILASTQFRANVNVLEVADELSSSLAGIKRSQ